LSGNFEFVEPDQHDLPCPVPFAKIFLFSADPNQLHIPSRLVPKEGRIAIVTDAGRDAVDARVSGAQWQSQGEMNLVSDQLVCEMIGALADGKAVVLAPVAGVKFAEAKSARPGFGQSLNPRMTVTRRIRRRGEHEISRKTIACGNAG